MSVSLVTACKNRNEALLTSLQSWLLLKEITEIIIVDWSSDTSLQDLKKHDKKIKVIRAQNETFYIPSQANNLGVSFVNNDHFIRVDTDYVFNPYYNFFENYKIDSNSYVCGEPEIPAERDNNPYYKYLFGLLYISKENFYKVNGYNENIGYYYSHEDKDIFERLKLAGFNQIKIKNDFNIIHLPHSDKKRFEHFEGGKKEQFDNEQIVVESHIGNNIRGFKQPSNFYTCPKVRWDIKQIDEQYFEANKLNNELEGIPSINCISLEESLDRRQDIQKQFKKYNVNHVDFLISKRFDDSNDIITGTHVNTLNKGTAGCCVSHLKNIQKWWVNTTEPYGFFCEDDFSLETVKYWGFSWKDFIEQLPNDWEIVQLLTIRKDYLDLNVRKRIWNDWSATAYVIKREYAKKIIDTYCVDDKFVLELLPPNNNIQPLIENILFVPGNCYTVPLFVENTKFNSTFNTTEDKDVHIQDQQKSNHLHSSKTVLQLWKNKQSSHKFNNLVNTAKVIDCFPFFNEKELLELRINMLQNFVDEFIIIDSNYTHSGQPKPYTCKQVLKELNLDSPKIKVIEADLSEEGCGIPTPYDLFYDSNAKHGSRERVQRDYLNSVLDNYTDNTVFIVSDCDEIINPGNIKFISDIVKSNQQVVCKIPLVYLQGQANYRVYKRDTKELYPWNCSMFFATKQQLKKHSPTHIRANFQLTLPITYITQDNKKLEDLGWHFSWMGNLDRVKTKAISYCHHGMVLDNYVYQELYGDKMLNYFDTYQLREGNYPISGLKDAFIQKYPIKDLPKEIFSLPNVLNFLLPNNDFLDFNNTLKEYSTDIDDPLKNFKLGYCYYQQGHTAPALSYFLRCAERTDDILLAYEALIYGYFCYKEQKIRDETAKSLIMHAVCLMPERPEARFLLSVFYEHKQQWMDSYYHANLGLAFYNKNCTEQPLKFYKDYPGKIGLLFQKAISGYWWGKNDECKNILIDLHKNYILDPTYQKLVADNLKRLKIDNI